jgi:hypothetical protein
MQAATRRRKIAVSHGQQRRSYQPSVFEDSVTDKALAVILPDFPQPTSGALPRFYFGEDLVSLQYALNYALLGQDPDGTFDPSQDIVELQLAFLQPANATGQRLQATQRRIVATAPAVAAATGQQAPTDLEDLLQNGFGSDEEHNALQQEEQQNKKPRNPRKLCPSTSGTLRQIVSIFVPVNAIAPEWMDRNANVHELPFPDKVAQVLVPKAADDWDDEQLELMKAVAAAAFVRNGESKWMAEIETKIKE